MSINTIPKISPRAPYIAWCQSHAEAFVANSAQIGLSAAKAAEYENNVAEAVAAIEEMNQIKAAYHAAVAKVDAAMQTLSNGPSGTSEVVATVRAFARGSATPNAVYSAALIDPPAPPTTKPAPAAPRDVRVAIEPVSGHVQLKWKARQPANGVTYIIKRRVNSAGPWEFIGTAGSDKSFADANLAPGAQSVQYSIQAQRSNLFSDATGLVVNFGVGAGVSAPPVKLAA
jgi:hypothetical protein